MEKGQFALGLMNGYMQKILFVIAGGTDVSLVAAPRHRASQEHIWEYQALRKICHGAASMKKKARTK